MIVSTAGLTKRYAGFTALDACSLEVGAGEIFGLLGPNGAGKTTLLRLLLGYIRPTAGRATVCGHDCATDSLGVRSRTAYLPGEARLFRRMTGDGVIRFFAELRRDCGRSAAVAIADRLGLDRTRQVGRMSTGMRQKLAIAVVLATDVPLVILDDPTIAPGDLGLDGVTVGDGGVVQDDDAFGRVEVSTHLLIRRGLLSLNEIIV